MLDIHPAAMHRKKVLAALLLVAVVLIGVLFFTAVSPLAAITCFKLESTLYHVAYSSQPEQTAKERGLHYAEGKVRVIVEMEDEDVSFPDGYGALVENRYGTLIQALVVPNELCVLSREWPVVSVRSPLRATPAL